MTTTVSPETERPARVGQLARNLHDLTSAAARRDVDGVLALATERARIASRLGILEHAERTGTDPGPPSRHLAEPVEVPA